MKYVMSISHGKETEYRRALFMLYSLFAHLSDWGDYEVILQTDRPAWFEPWVAGLPVELRLLTKERIHQLKGEIQFVHLLKITLLKDLLAEKLENTLFIDSDTFFLKSAESIFGWIQPGQSVMHVKEYPFSSLLESACPTRRSYGKFFTDNLLRLPGETPKLVDMNSSSWNSGVLGLSPSTLPFFDDIHAMATEIFQETRCPFSEQYAYSICLGERTAVVPCEDVIFHYFPTWDKWAMDDYLRRLMTPWWLSQPLSRRCSDVLSRCRVLPTLIPRLPQQWRWKSLHAFGQRRFVDGYRQAFRYLLAVRGRDLSFWRDLMFVTRQIVLKPMQRTAP